MQHEDAAVPEIGPSRQILFGHRFLRLFDEAIDEIGLICRAVLAAIQSGTIEGRTAPNISVSGMGAVGLDTKQHQPTICCHRSGFLDGNRKCQLVPHHVIGRHHDQHGFRRLSAGDQRRHRNRGCGIARHRLEHDRVRFRAGTLQFLAHEEAVIGVAQDDRWLVAVGHRKPSKSCTEECLRLAVKEANELLRVHRPRQRPQARSRATRQYNGKQHTRHAHELRIGKLKSARSRLYQKLQ